MFVYVSTAIGAVYGKVTVDEIEHVGHPADVNTVRRSITDALGATDFTMIYYELEPGDSFSGGFIGMMIKKRFSTFCLGQQHSTHVKQLMGRRRQ